MTGEGAHATWLRRAPLLTVCVLVGPVIAGIAGTVAPALGYLPALGGVDVGPGPFLDLLAWPGLPRAAGLSLFTGVAATLLSLIIVLLITAGWQGTAAFAVIERVLSPLLSVPHAAAALGLAFLIAPSGWIARALSPWATGWDRPPDLLILQDPAGLALTLGLIVKEVPFLFLMVLAALPQVRAGQRLTIARALGYRPVAGWFKTVLPGLYRQIRLPVYAVLAYSMSVVDMAAILGPTRPPTLSVMIVQWANDPDLMLRFRAAAAAVLQLGLTATALGLWWLAEGAVAALGRRWTWAGGRGSAWAERVLAWGGLLLGGLCAAAVAAGMAGLALWSVAGLWPFPDALPERLSLQVWLRHGPALSGALADTVLIAAAAALIGLALTIACLEAEYRHGLAPGARALWLLYLPLIVPQTAFLPGLQTLALMAHVDGGRGAVIAAHLTFVLPYVFLSLADPWRAWDSRLGWAGRALGASPGRVLWRLRLPQLAGAVLTAGAVGFAVSAGQYLPTLLVGAGRVQTITTEAVALAAGGDRRVIGVFGVTQAAVALAPFLLAVALPRILWRNRAGLGHAGV